jgi:hypothetical protein
MKPPKEGAGDGRTAVIARCLLPRARVIRRRRFPEAIATIQFGIFDEST